MLYKILIGLLCIVFLCSGVYILVSNFQKKVPEKVTNDAFEAFWVDYIETHTPSLAYVKFKEAYAVALPTEQHLVAHLFGGALYTSVGISGLSICDMHFASGCFHEFLGRALQEHGESILNDVDTYCKESLFDCQHGIGHGIVAYNGYEFDNLLKAIEMCIAIGTTDVRDGCLGGIFMEYNIRTMLSPEVPVRTQNETEAPDDLCQKVPNSASQACYFWLPQWLLSFRESPLEKKILEVAQECQTIKDTSSRLTCYSGLANEFISYTDDIKLMGSYCDELSISKDDPLYTVQCRSGVASGLFMDLDTRENAIDLCAELSSKEYDFCEFYATKADGKRIIPYTQWLETAE